MMRVYCKQKHALKDRKFVGHFLFIRVVKHDFIMALSPFSMIFYHANCDDSELLRYDARQNCDKTGQRRGEIPWV